MNSRLFAKNLAVLEKNNRVLAEALKSLRPGGGFIVTPSRKGPPSLARTFPGGGRKTLHSSYDPIKEAVRFMDSSTVDDFSNFIVLGVGLGYHIQELIKRIPSSSRILIAEREIEVFYHCLMNNDFTSVMDRPGVRFQVGTDASGPDGILDEDRFQFALNGYSIIRFQPLINTEYYSNRLKKIEAVINEAKINLNSKAAFSRVFYKNIFSNWKNLLNSPGIHSLKDAFQGVPAIIVSAGPSLDKNISILKSSSHRAVVIAAATALRPLIQNGIEVDFVIVIDSGESSIQFFDCEYRGKNVWLVFDPCIPHSIVDLFPNKKIKIDSGVYLSHWIASKSGENNYLGKTFSVAHAAFLFSHHLGCGPVIFTGQDLSFNRNQLHCAGSYFDQVRKDKITAFQPLNHLEEKRYFEFSSSFKSSIDIFGKEIITTCALDVYKNIFAENIEGNGSILNATEGGADIPGVPNRTLREVLNVHCPENPGPRKLKFPGSFNEAGGSRKIKSDLIEQSKRFNKIHRDVQKMRVRFIDSYKETESHKNEFVGSMEGLFQFLLDQPETLELMQGYAYAGFIEWNRQNGKIAIKEEKSADVLEDRFQRDKKFLDVLEETAETLKKAFDKMAKEMN